MQQKNRKTIILLGASFNTGNLGVSALAWSSVKVILHRWPKSKIFFLGVGRKPDKSYLRIMGQNVDIDNLPIRFCLNFLANNHILQLLFWTLLAKIMPGKWITNKLIKRHDTVGILFKTDVIADITGGDSFSDIYGIGRFLRGYLVKRLCQFTGKPVVMLPQTYGPFKQKITRVLARRVLRKAARIYSRDQEGLDILKRLLGRRVQARLCPDVAFILEPHRIENRITALLEQYRREGKTLIGLNISGLLYYGGYTGKNEFGLKVDYPRLVEDIISWFAAMQDTVILLVPHVFPEEGTTENDLLACRETFGKLPEQVRKRVLIAEGEFDCNQIKYIIGRCDFFLGSRMHSCIAAISQMIPAVGMAYSKKFSGVFMTAGINNNVLDLRSMTNSEYLACLEKVFERRLDTRKKLEEVIPDIQKKVLALLYDLEIRKN